MIQKEGRNKTDDVSFNRGGNSFMYSYLPAARSNNHKTAAGN